MKTAELLRDHEDKLQFGIETLIHAFINDYGPIEDIDIDVRLTYGIFLPRGKELIDAEVTVKVTV